MQTWGRGLSVLGGGILPLAWQLESFFLEFSLAGAAMAQMLEDGSGTGIFSKRYNSPFGTSLMLVRSSILVLLGSWATTESSNIA